MKFTGFYLILILVFNALFLLPEAEIVGLFNVIMPILFFQLRFLQKSSHLVRNIY